MKISKGMIVVVLSAVLILGLISVAFAELLVESYIVGKFTGLKKGNVYHLQNGQVWQQTELWTQRLMVVRPVVTINKGAAGAKMKVEGIDREVAVERVK